MQADLNEFHQTSRQEGYTSSGAHNMLGIRDSFANLAQATKNYQAAVTNLTTVNTILTEQGGLYYNRLSKKDVYNESLHMETWNL